MQASIATDCNLCNEKITSFNTLITHSLYGKYSSSQNFYYSKQVNQILEQSISAAYINYQDNNYYDNEEEFMKREYKEEQFSKKIQMLSQYYKFHRDLPIWNQRNVQTIMGKHYNKLKDVDYKKIKSVLKKQQGISLTTHKSFSSLDDSQYTKKSRYSTMLQDLQVSNDQLILRQVCQKIGKALKKVKYQNNFKGTYYSGEKKFQQFLKKQKKRKQSNRNQGQFNKQHEGFKKIKFNPKLVTKDDQVQGLKQINFTSDHSIKERKYLGKNTISIQKTTANQTISRQQKSRREKNKSNHQSSRYTSISRKSSTTKNLAIADLLKPLLMKQVKSSNILSKMNNNQNMKTVNQIYRPQRERKQSIQGDIPRKSSSKQLVSRLKLRSNSHHNLPTAAILSLNRDASKNKLINTLKISRNPSKSNIPSAITKGSLQLQNNGESTQRIYTARQSNHKIIRTSSSGKLVANSEKQYKTAKNIHDKQTSKRRSAIQQILAKKLNVFKRKQAVL